ncbi:MAG: Rpn family recombination-promoting nuclease/putative transposase [Clostridia bacterium]|nr:Rpn family recombination-promoting nuclease/putative transposase [Clostridia bacterium]
MAKRGGIEKGFLSSSRQGTKKGAIKMSKKELSILSDTISPKEDMVFKKLFGSKGNEAILKDLLEYILDIQIKEIKLDLSTEVLPERYKGKSSRIDVRAELDNGTKVDIEMQSEVKGYNEKRCLEYWSKLYTNDIMEGDDYAELKKTICVWIVDGKVYKEFEEFESTWKMKEDKLGISGHFQDIEIHVIELQKFREADIIKPSKKDFWLWFIDHTNEEMVNMAYITDERIKEAREQLEKIMADKELYMEIVNRQMYEMDQRLIAENNRKEGMEKGLAEGMEKGLAEGREKGLAEGREKGLAEGRAEGKEEGEKSKQLEIAQKLKNKGIDTDTIIETTGLTKEEVEAL